jgi:hypothetical protein
LFVMNSGNDFYVSNASSFKMTNYYPSSGFTNPIAAFNASADWEDYFKSMVTYWANSSIWG